MLAAVPPVHRGPVGAHLREGVCRRPQREGWGGSRVSSAATSCLALLSPV